MELKAVLESSDVNEISRRPRRCRRPRRSWPRPSTRRRPRSRRGCTGGNGTASADDEVVEEADYEVIDEERGEDLVMPEEVENSEEVEQVERRGRRARGAAGRERGADRHAPARQGRVRQLPQAGRARPGEPGRAGRRADRQGAPARPRRPGAGARGAAEQHEEAKLEEGVRLVHRQLERAARARGARAEIETDGQVRPARPRGAAHPAVRGRGGRP